MTELLTPDELEEILNWDGLHLRLAATLRAYAKVVEAVAEKSPYRPRYVAERPLEFQCHYCGYLHSVVQHESFKGDASLAFHLSGCLYLRARELRKR